MKEIQQFLWQLARGFLSFAITLVIGVIIVKLLLIPVKKFILKSKLDHTAKTFIFSIVRVILYSVVVLSAFGTAKVDMTSIITTIGALGLTAGLAFQETLKNFVSGIIVLFNKPITAGDLIQIEDCEGYVDSVRIFYTQIHTYDNKIVQIPNSKITTNKIYNLSAGENRRVDIYYSISYEDNITKAKSIIYDVISKNPMIQQEPEPKVYVSNHLDSGIELRVNVWTKAEKYYDVLYAMNEDVKNAFDENGITIPYPHVQIADNAHKS